MVYVGSDLVGDGLVKLPFLRALRNAFPTAEITWLAGRGRSVYAHGLAPLVRDLVDRVVEGAEVGRRWQEVLRPPLKGTSLEGRRFDLVIDTQRRVGTALLLRRIPHGCFISAAADYSLSARRPAQRKAKPPSRVRRLLDLVELASGRPADPTGEPPADPRNDDLAATLLPGGRSYVGLAPGAGNDRKCWPLERFIELAAAQKAAGRTPVILLGPEESDWAARVREALPAALLPLQSDAVKRRGPSPLITIALAQRLSLAVANDAGIAHMLAAANCPLVSLFGPTLPEKAAPVVRHGRILRAQDYARNDSGNGDDDAMELIPLSAVQEAITDLLGEIETTTAAMTWPGGKAVYS